MITLFLILVFLVVACALFYGGFVIGYDVGWEDGIMGKANRYGPSSRSEEE